MFDPDFQTFVLAQADGSPPPGAGAVPPSPEQGVPLTGDGGAAGNGGGAAPADPFGRAFFPILLLLLLTMIIVTLMGQRRDRKKRQAMLGSIRKHDRVQTVGGVIGSITEIKPDTVILKVDESSNTRMTFARSAIQQVLSSGPEEEAGEQ